MRYVLAFLCMCTGLNAHAGFNYSFQASVTGAPTTLGQLAFGDGTAPVDLTFYLVQTPTGGDVPGLFKSTGASFLVNKTAGVVNFAIGNSGPFNLQSTSGASRINNGHFGLPATSPGSSLVNGFHAIEIGTMTVTGPLGSVGTFAFADIDTLANNVTVDGVSVDSSAFANSSSFTVAVPEPSSMLMLGSVALGLTFRRRRRG